MLISWNFNLHLELGYLRYNFGAILSTTSLDSTHFYYDGVSN